jgi:hypothetical protein
MPTSATIGAGAGTDAVAVIVGVRVTPCRAGHAALGAAS